MYVNNPLSNLGTIQCVYNNVVAIALDSSLASGSFIIFANEFIVL